MLEKMLALQNKRKKEGGFTLVELIVVLVILAILAALLIPALTGYIDKAKDKSIIAETRQCVMAAQTLADEAYGKVQAGASVTVTPADVKKLAEVKGTVSDISFDTADKSKITGLKYTINAKVCTYTTTPDTGKDNYTVADTTPSTP